MAEQIDFAPNHNIQRSDYVRGLQAELAGTPDKARKAEIQAEIDAVTGRTAAVQAPKETA